MQLTATARAVALASLLLTLSSGCLRARTTTTRRGVISLHGGYYGDDDRVTVWNPSARATVPVTERLSLHGSYGVDIIAAASVDIVASASRVLEQRHEVSAGASGSPDLRTTLRATYRASREPDYGSDGLTLSFDRETSDRARTFHAEIRGRYDRVGPGWLLQSAAPLVAMTAAGSVTQVVDRVTLVRVGLQTDVLDGLQSSVYRYVPIAGVAYPERVPDVRVRQSGLVRVQRSLVPTLAVYAEYDLTIDSWGVHGHTGDAGASWEVTPWLRMDARARVTWQSATSFYHARYDALTDFRTRDRMLGGVLTWWPRIAIRIAWPPWPAAADWEFGVGASILHQLFRDFEPLSQRTAAVLDAWVERSF